MADDAKVDISIKTTADTSGAEKAAVAVREVGDASKEASASQVTGNLAATAATDKATLSLREVGKEMKAGKLLAGSLGSIMAGDLSGGIKGAMLATRGLNLALAGSPIGLVIAGFTVAAVVAAKFGSAAKEASKEAKDLGGSAKEAGDNAKGAAAKLEEIKTSGDFAREGMEEAKRGADPLAASLDAVAKAADAARKRMDALDDADLAIKTAEIDQQEFEGKLTGPQADKQRATARNDSAMRKLMRERDTNAEELATKEFGKGVIDNDKASAEADRDKAQAKATAIHEAIEEGGPKDEATRAAQQKRLDEAWADFDRLSGKVAEFADRQKKAADELLNLQNARDVVDRKIKAQSITGAIPIAKAENDQRVLERDENQKKIDQKFKDKEVDQQASKKAEHDQKAEAAADKKDAEARARDEVSHAKAKVKDAEAELSKAKPGSQKAKRAAKKKADAEGEVSAAELGLKRAQGTATPGDEELAEAEGAAARAKAGKGSRAFGGPARKSDYDQKEDARRSQEAEKFQQAAGDLKGSGVKEAATAVEQLGPALQSLVSAINASTGQIPAIWQAIAAIQSERTGSVG